MNLDILTFQLATHYLPKIALKLEILLQSLQNACEEVHPMIHHYALINLLEITKLIEKPELKSRFLKEFLRLEHATNKWKNVQQKDLQEQLYKQIHILNQVLGRFGGTIHSNPFLQSLRIMQPLDQDCQNYSPQLIMWLDAAADKRKQDFHHWMESLRPLALTVNFYLNLLRSSAEFMPIKLIQGFYQQPITHQTTHLILLRIKKTSHYVPRMQMGHHSFSIRLYDRATLQEMRECHSGLELAICQL